MKPFGKDKPITIWSKHSRKQRIVNDKAKTANIYNNFLNDIIGELKIRKRIGQQVLEMEMTQQ